MVVFARRDACSRCCSFFPRAFFRAAASFASVAPCSCISAWASSVTRWAAARASVTLDDPALVRRVVAPCAPVIGVSFGSCVVIGVCLLLASHGSGGNQTTIRFEAGCRVLAKAGCHVSKKAGCRAKSRQDVATRLFAHRKTASLLALSLPGCSQTACDRPAQRRSILGSGRRDSNPRQPAWKAGTLPIKVVHPHLSCKGTATLLRK